MSHSAHDHWAAYAQRTKMVHSSASTFGDFVPFSGIFGLSEGQKGIRGFSTNSLRFFERERKKIVCTAATNRS